MKKGISTIIAAILLLLIAISLVISFLAWSTNFVGKYKNIGNEKTEETLTKFGTSFYIYEVQGNIIRIKNNGQNIIKADDLHVYLNRTKVSAINDTPSIAPGEILNFTLSQSTDNYNIEVSGPYGKHDEVSGELITTTISTTTSISYSTCNSGCKAICGSDWAGMCDVPPAYPLVVCDYGSCIAGCVGYKAECTNYCVCNPTTCDNECKFTCGINWVGYCSNQNGVICEDSCADGCSVGNSNCGSKNCLCTFTTTTSTTSTSTTTSISSPPDLFINNVYVAGGIAIFYNVRNSGGSTADSSTAQLYIDGSPVATDDTPAIVAGGGEDEVFNSYSWSCTDPSDIVRVCVDIYNNVSESNEGNNCYTSTWYCP